MPFARAPRGFGAVIKMKGNRRRPYVCRIMRGYKYNLETGKATPNYIIVGYAATKKEGLMMLAKFHENPVYSDKMNATFKDVYEGLWEEKLKDSGKSSMTAYRNAFNILDKIHDKKFRTLNTGDLEKAMIDTGKNYPTQRKTKVLLNQMYNYAMKNDICQKDWSQYIDMDLFRNKNPNAFYRKAFEKKQIDTLWTFKGDHYYEIILMLIYSGLRISELLELKKEDVNMKEHHFKVTRSKTENGVRVVPIADCVYPFFEFWYNDNEKSEYLIHMPNGKPFKYRNYYDVYFFPLMEQLGYKQTPHCCRHTCVSLLAEAKVDPTTIKKIVGHSGAMTMTERVYTHLDPKILIDAVNTMYIPKQK